MRLFSITLVLIFLLSISSCKNESGDASKFYGEFNPENDMYLYDDDIYVVGNDLKKINLFKLINDSSNQFLINEVHCVTDERVYFSYSYFINDTKFWLLSSVEWDGTNFKKFYEGEFPTNTASYQIVIDKDYSYRNGFFYDDKIVLSDSGKVVEFDIKTESIREYLNNYQFPELKYTLFISNNKKSIVINDPKDNTQKVLSIDYIANNILGKEPEKCSFYYIQNSNDKIFLYILYDAMSLTKNKLYVYEYNVLTEQYTFIFSRYNVFDEYELSVVPKIEGGSAIGT